MNTTIISINANVGNNDNCQPQMMTSLEIAELTGKQHKDVMKAIRNMEPAWVKVRGRNFALSSRTYEIPNGGTREVPCYQLTKTECLYIATKFNDEARAKLVLRREELEKGKPNLEKIFDKNRVENLKRKSLNSNAIGGYEEIMSKAFDF